MELGEKVFVVTGAGSGMGRQLTIELVRRGARVAAVDMRAATLDETKALTGSDVATFVLDVTDADAVAALPERVINALGAVDGLINNAGIIQPFLKLDQLTVADIERVMAVNFTAPLNLIRAFLPHLKSRPEAHILNVASMGAYAPVPGQSLYGASKAALAQLSEGLRSELLSTNIRVITAYPGAINTNIATNSGIAVSESSAANSAIKTTDANLAAQLMIDALERGRERVFIGSDARMLNLLARVNPKFAAWLIYRNMRSLLGE
ncbi:MAG: hypothetical protein RLZZ478_106 [Actinomycetota bacterium]|jgi:NAD(P)-dependent dehydrogenase (short-subunit alcohol dehydrogenase family)